MTTPEYKGIKHFEVNHSRMYYGTAAAYFEVDFTNEDTLKYIKDYVEEYECGKEALYHCKGDYVKAFLSVVSSRIIYLHLGSPGMSAFDMVNKFNATKGNPAIDGSKGIRLKSYEGIDFEPLMYEVKEDRQSKTELDD